MNFIKNAIGFIFHINSVNSSTPLCRNGPDDYLDIIGYAIKSSQGPTSSMNVIYKLESAVISNRLKMVLGNIINENQKGFIAGRFLGENVRLMFESKKQNLPGLLLSIDFEKAFDTV